MRRKSGDERELALEAARIESDIQRRLNYHPPQPGQPARYELIRSAARDYARLLVKECPPSDELDRALDRLDEVVMLANAAIARNE